MMKKIILGLVIIILASCGDASNTNLSFRYTKNHMIVYRINCGPDNIATYYYYGIHDDILGSIVTTLEDSCGKFNIGDTLIMVKK